MAMKKNKRIPSPAIGWPLLPVPEKGTLHFPSLEQSIKQSIKIILLTRPGEQLMRPLFGAGLSRFLHKPNTRETRQSMQMTVQETLNKFEKRIVVNRVDILQDENPDAIRIEIMYRILRTGEQAKTMLTMTIGN